MDLELPSTADIASAETTLAAVIGEARSLGEIETWLRTQPSVVSVRLGSYLAKSQPPQRDFIVELRAQDGSKATRAIGVLDLGDGHFQFRGLHDA
jgi:hypothetical protein